MESKASRVKIDLRRAFVIDDDATIYQFVTAALLEQGFKVESYSTAKAALDAIGAEHPGIIFLDVALLKSDAIDVLIGLGAIRYCGAVNLMSGGRPQLLEGVQRLGTRHGVKLAPPIQKPISQEAIVQAVADMDSLIAAPPPQNTAGKAAAQKAASRSNGLCG